MKALVVPRHGGAEVLTQVELPVPQPKANEIVVKISAIGINFIDIYYREGRYPATLPFVDGMEAAGIVHAIGDDVIVYTRQDFETETKRLTDGKGVHVIYDGVGKSTFDKDLNLLRPRGYLALFGAASGPVPAFDPILLSQKGSIFLTRPTLGHHIASRKELEQRSGEVFQQIAGKKLKLRIEHVYKLGEAARAQRDLEARKTTGKLLLVP